jgi:hypothetical protein
MKTSVPHVVLKPEPQPEAREPDVSLDSKAATVACGKVMKLDQAAFIKLNLIPRFSKLVEDTGFTDKELKEISSASDLSDQEFEAYSFGYLTWEKSKEISRTDFDALVIKAVQSIDQKTLSAAERTKLAGFMVKFKTMMVKAFELGRRDATMSPCQF